MRVPAVRMLLESDGPFVRIGQRLTEPADTSSVFSRIADVWGVATDEARSPLTTNFRRLIYEG
jgi:TatD DNase family protein